MSDILNRSSAEIFEQVTLDLVERFAYVSDKEAYGLTERWAPCREVGGRMVGDCEDFCITIAEACDRAGVPAQDLTLYLVAVERSPDHVVIGCGEWIADCNARSLKRKGAKHYFRWVSERNLGQDKWVSSQ